MVTRAVREDILSLASSATKRARFCGEISSFLHPISNSSLIFSATLETDKESLLNIAA
jgi:hypothetical protein